MAAEGSTAPPGGWFKVYLVLLLLSVCYFGKYFCTSDMYIVQRLFMMHEGVSSQQLSIMFAIGYGASMVGKVAAGAMCDAIGGKFVVIFAACGYTICTLLFSFVPTGAHALGCVYFLWAWNGFFALGLAWVSVVAVATNWVPMSHLGRLMSLLSMAPQLGDAIARLCLAHFIAEGWRVVFQRAALTAAGLLVPVLVFVQNAPPGAEHTKHAAGPQEPYFKRLKVLLSNPFLWVLCLLSGSLYGTRTLFLLYSTTFLSQAYCFNSEDMGQCTAAGQTLKATALASSAYTLLGCVSVLLVGVLKDHLPVRHRGATLTIFVAPLFLILAYLTHTGVALPFGLAAVLVALIGFCLFGPYKVLGAVFAVDVGGKELKSTCTAFMGIFDNFFAMVMLLGKGQIGDDWQRIFTVLAVLSGISFACAAYIWIRDLTASRAVRAMEPLLSSEA